MRPETLFITKTWGFSPEQIPLIGFSTEEAQNNFLRRSKRDPNTWVAILATNGTETDPSDRGRLLGAVRPSFEKLDSDAVLREEGIVLSETEYENGVYRWPWGFPVIDAVRFENPPHSDKLFGGLLRGQDWALYAIPVTERLGYDKAVEICELATLSIALPKLKAIDRARAYANALGGQRHGLSGPPPNEGGGGGVRTLGAGYAYAFRLHGGLFGDAFKIGSTADPEARREALNAELRPAVTGCVWKPVLKQHFETIQQAYNFEQRIIAELQEHLVGGEREIVRLSESELQNAWARVLFQKHWIDGPGPGAFGIQHEFVPD